MAERTGLEPATPGVTGRYSNQLNYRSIDDNIGDNIGDNRDENKNDNLLPVQDWWVLQGSNLRPTACKAVALPTELNTPIRQKPCPMEHFATNNLLRVCLQIALGEKRANCTDWRLAVKEVAPCKPPSVKNSLQKPPLGTKPLSGEKPSADKTPRKQNNPSCRAISRQSRDAGTRHLNDTIRRDCPQKCIQLFRSAGELH